MFGLNIEALVLLGPALFLVLMGLWVAMRSGASGRRTVTRVRLAWENFSSLILALAAWVFGLAAAQFAVGLRLGW